jgi:eukaryotic-like serine/threonine-protein kinase
VLAIATYAYVRIYHERNAAVRVSKELDTALLGKQAEADKARAAAQWALSANASNLLLSDLPNRRAKGLDLLRKVVDPEKAVELDQDAALTPAQLRDQAVEFLVLRDVEPQPGFPTGSTRGIEFALDGTVLAALSSDDKEVTLWNVEQRQKIETITMGEVPTKPSSLPARGEGLERPGSGERSGTGGRGEPSRPGTGQNSRSNSNRGPMRIRRLSPDRLALAGYNLAVIRPQDDGLRLIDIRTGSTLHDLDRAGRTILSVLASPTGERLLTIERIPDPARKITPAARLLPGLPGFEDMIEVVLWDLSRTDVPVKVLDQFKMEPRRFGAPAFAAFSPDGRTVALAPNKGTTYNVSLHSALDGTELGQIETQSELLSSLALGANNLMATAAGNTIQLWDREAKTFLTSLSSTRGMAWIMRFNPQGTLLAVAGGNHVELWDAVSHKLLAVLPVSEGAAVSDLCFGPDGRTFAVGSRVPPASEGGAQATSTSVWRVSASTARIQLGGFEAQTRPTSLAFSSNGCLAIGATSGDVWLYRDGGNRCTSTTSPVTASTDPAVRAVDRERERPRRTSVMIDASGRLIAYDGRALRIWRDASVPSQIPSFVSLPPTLNPLGPWEPMTLLAHSGDGLQVALVRGSELLLWRTDKSDQALQVVQLSRNLLDLPPDLALLPPSSASSTAGTGRSRSRTEQRGRSEGPPRNGSFRNISALQIAPKGDRVYLLVDVDRSGNNKLVILGLDSKTSGGPIIAHKIESSERLTENLTSMSLRSDGSLLALGDHNGAVTLLDTTSLMVLGRIRLASKENQGMVFAMTFAPDGRALAVGSSQGEILLWSIANPAFPRLGLRLPGQQGPVINLAFHPRGHRLASISLGEPRVDIWNLDLLREELGRLGLFE